MHAAQQKMEPRKPSKWNEVTRSNLWPAELRVNQLIAFHQGDSQLSGDYPPPRLHRHIVALADVVDVHRNGGVRANAVFLHVRYELTLCQVIWRRRLALCDTKCTVS